MPDIEPDIEDDRTEHGHRQDEGAENPTGDRDVDPKLLEILVCPLTKTPLRYDRRARELISDQAGLAFPIRNGVPIMLVDEARALDDDPVSPGIAALAERNNGSVPK